MSPRVLIVDGHATAGKAVRAALRFCRPARAGAADSLGKFTRNGVRQRRKPRISRCRHSELAGYLFAKV
jgi:orotate phosphoribosyltransferase